MNADITIVIVSFNVRDDLANCLESLARHPPSRPHEIIVVDNASADGSLEMVRKRWPRVRAEAMAANVGFAAANNAGIRRTAANGSRWVLLLNADTIVEAGALDRLVERAEHHPGVAIAGPRLVDREGHPEVSFGRMPGPLNEARQKRLGRAYAARVPWAVCEVEERTASEHFPDWVSGACLLVRRDEAEAVGLLDERYFMYLEDADLCAAVRGRGGRVLFTPAATITHLRGRARATARAAVETGYRRSHLAFYRKHHPLWAPALWIYLKIRGLAP